MPFHTRTKDDPGDVGRAADQQQSVDNDNYLESILEGDHTVRRQIHVHDIPDNVATTIFTIKTTDEFGAMDAGAYAVRIHGSVVHLSSVDPETSDEVAIKGFGAQWARAMDKLGAAGANSAVTENLETAVATTNAGQRTITTVTLTLVEVSEFEVDVKILIDLGGANIGVGCATFNIELVWCAFYSPPTIELA